jgi:hypothetical protein
MIALNYKSTAAIARHLLAGTVKRLNSNSKLPHYSSRDILNVKKLRKNILKHTSGNSMSAHK